ncbi:hypothetical protein E2C01_002593 [Portunus trituberculatus]|uniref:Uncharacterized protein n=1 Tax=Portunus trituberculatus TaxID=210409 RepID=A0A5B7CJS2_PORTR|nr:hypothetical protein [Portunus trituberculatus]
MRDPRGHADHDNHIVATLELHISHPPTDWSQHKISFSHSLSVSRVMHVTHTSDLHLPTGQIVRAEEK